MGPGDLKDFQGNVFAFLRGEGMQSHIGKNGASIAVEERGSLALRKEHLWLRWGLRHVGFPPKITYLANALHIYHAGRGNVTSERETCADLTPGRATARVR